MADEKQIRQVLGNIVKNSYENFKEAGISSPKIKVICKKNNKSLELIISDNGSGIKKENLDNLMDPYFSTKRNGTGLGLSISKKIIEDHNGKILLNSFISKGTEVILICPYIKNE